MQNSSKTQKREREEANHSSPTSPTLTHKDLEEKKRRRLETTLNGLEVDNLEDFSAEDRRLSLCSESTIGVCSQDHQEDGMWVQSTPDILSGTPIGKLIASDEVVIKARSDNEYEKDIVKTWVRKEKRLHTTSRIVELQETMSRDVYADMISSIMYVCDACKLNDDTLPLAAQIVARILAMFRVPGPRLPYLTLAALHIAAKYCNTQAPHIQDYAYVLNISVDSAKVIQMESVVLGALSYELGLPTAYTFAMAWLDHANLTTHGDCVHMVKLLINLCAMEVSLLDFSPSAVAASVVVTVLQILEIKSVGIDWHWDITQDSRELAAVSRNLKQILLSLGGVGPGRAMPPPNKTHLVVCANKAVQWAHQQSQTPTDSRRSV